MAVAKSSGEKTEQLSKGIRNKEVVYYLVSCNCYWSSTSGVNSEGRMVKNLLPENSLENDWESS